MNKEESQVKEPAGYYQLNEDAILTINAQEIDLLIRVANSYTREANMFSFGKMLEDKLKKTNQVTFFKNPEAPVSNIEVIKPAERRVEEPVVLGPSEDNPPDPGYKPETKVVEMFPEEILEENQIS